MTDPLGDACSDLEEATVRLSKFLDEYVIINGYPIPRPLVEQSWRQMTNWKVISAINEQLRSHGLSIDFDRDRKAGAPYPLIFERPYAVITPWRLWGFRIGTRTVGKVKITCSHSLHKHTTLNEFLEDQFLIESHDPLNLQSIQESYAKAVDYLLKKEEHRTD